MNFLIERHETDAAERPGAGKRARAVIAFVELAQRIEAGVTAVERQIELIRAMDKPTAKRFLKGIKRMLESLETLSAAEAPEVIEARVEALESTRSSSADLGANNDDLTSSDPEAPEAPQASPPPTLEPQDVEVVDLQLPEPSVEEAEITPIVPVKNVSFDAPNETLLNLRQLDAIQDTPEAVEWAFKLAREVLDDAEVLEGERLKVQNDNAITRLKSFLAAIHETQKTVLGVDDVYLVSQMAKYIDAAQTLMSSRIVNAACTYAYLKGAPLEYIVSLRSVTKSGAKAADVHNSIAAVKQVILRANRKASEESIDVVSPHGEPAVELDETHVELVPPVVDSGIVGVDAPESVGSDGKPSDGTSLHDLDVKLAVSAQPISSEKLGVNRPPVVAPLEPTELAPGTVSRNKGITPERRSLRDVRKEVLCFMLDRGIDEKMAMALLDYRRTSFLPEQAKEVLSLRGLFGVEDVRPTSDKLFQTFSQQQSLTPGQNKRLAWYLGFRVHTNGDGTRVLQSEAPHPIGWIRNAAKNTDGPDRAERDLLAALEKFFGYFQENQS